MLGDDLPGLLEVGRLVDAERPRAVEHPADRVVVEARIGTNLLGAVDVDGPVDRVVRGHGPAAHRAALRQQVRERAVGGHRAHEDGRDVHLADWGQAALAALLEALECAIEVGCRAKRACGLQKYDDIVAPPHLGEACQALYHAVDGLRAVLRELRRP